MAATPNRFWVVVTCTATATATGIITIVTITIVAVVTVAVVAIAVITIAVVTVVTVAVIAIITIGSATAFCHAGGVQCSMMHSLAVFALGIASDSIELANGANLAV